MDDDLVAQFVGITSSTPERAEQYLKITEENLEQAIQLYFDSNGADLGVPVRPTVTASTSDDIPPPDLSGVRVYGGRSNHKDDPIEIDSDDSEEEDEGQPRVRRVAAAADREDDEAMARRLQEELYAGGAVDSDGVRAPIARTRETLVGPDSYGAPVSGMSMNMMQGLAAQQTQRRQGMS
jgi:hypothetical protein